MPNYTVQVRDIAQRRQEIEQKRQNPLGWRAFYEHRLEGEQLPLITVELTTPIYRMANYRTRTAQLSFVHRQGVPADFFQLGEEDVQAQRAQHELLVTLAEKGSGETIKAIMEILRADQHQTEPLLLTLDGVIVNGNRRLAAMRELFQLDPTRFACFQQVQAMVLPETTPNDLRRIEVRLQMRPESRLPYDWTNKALAVRDLQERGLAKAEIVSLMQLDRDADVDTIIERLCEAEIYLNDFWGVADDYSAVDGAEQQFNELQKALRSKTRSEEKELARKLCHVITRHSRELNTRSYEYRVAFGPQIAEVATRLAERLNVPAAPLTDAPAPAAIGDLFGDVATVGIGGFDFSALGDALSDRGRSQQNAQAIKEVCDEIREEASEQNRGRRALRAIEKALASLVSVDIDSADPDTLGEIYGLLEPLIARAQALLVSVESRQN